MHQIFNSVNGHMWQKRGRDGTKHIKSNTGRRRLNILGAVNLHTKHVTPFLTEANCDRETIKVFLTEIKKVYSKAKSIRIYLDNARYQKSYEVKNHAKNLGITLNYIPPYSPNLCLIERLWKFFKKKVIKNKYYPTWHEFYQAVCNFFQDWHKWKVELESLLTMKFEIINCG